MAERIFLWSVPRSRSTAFERSIRNLDSAEVFHEPFYDAYHYGPERMTMRFLSRPPVASATYKAVKEQLLTNRPDTKVVFAKNHSFYITGRVEDLFQPGYLSFTHSFIIRNPECTIPSMYKAAEKSNHTWDENSLDLFCRAEAGFAESYKLYQLLKQKLGYSPIVIDSDDILHNPEGMMEAYCLAVGIPFKKSMTTWVPGMLEDWNCGNCFDVWHAELAASTGFSQQEKESFRKHFPRDIPDIISQCIQECKPAYEALHSVRLQPKCLDLF